MPTAIVLAAHLHRREPGADRSSRPGCSSGSSARSNRSRCPGSATSTAAATPEAARNRSSTPVVVRHVRCHHHGTVDRRSCCRRVASVVVAPLLTFEPRGGRPTRPRCSRRVHQRRPPPTGTTCRSGCRGASREIQVAYDLHAHRHRHRLQLQRHRHRHLRPVGSRPGQRAGFRGWSGGARRSLPDQPERRHARLPRRPDHARACGTSLLGPVRDRAAGSPYEVTVTLVFGRRGRRFEPKPAPTDVPGTGPGWYRGDLHLHTVHSDGKRTRREMVAARAGGRAGLLRLHGAQHQLGDHALGPARARRPAGRQRRGDHDPRRALARDGPARRHLDRLALPPRGRPARGGSPTGSAALGGARDRLPPVRPGPQHQVGLRLRLRRHGRHRALERAVDRRRPARRRALARACWSRAASSRRSAPPTPTTTARPSASRRPSCTPRPLSTAAVVAAVKAGQSWLAESSAVDLRSPRRRRTRRSPAATASTPRRPTWPTSRLTVAGAPGCVAQVIGPAGVRWRARRPTARAG